MNYAEIKKRDIANGPGVRVSLFVSGCRKRCKNCFNRQAQDFSYGSEFTENTVNEIIEAARPYYIQGISLLGGEPFEPENINPLIGLVKTFRKVCPEKNVWCYTGFDFEKDILPGNRGSEALELLKLIDVLVDGEFIEELKSVALIFRGSSNQRIIDVKASLKSGKAVLLPGEWERKWGSGGI